MKKTYLRNSINNLKKKHNKTRTKTRTKTHNKRHNKTHKKTYISKNKKGGMGHLTQYWNQHPDFNIYNQNAKRKLLLLEGSNGTQYELYEPLLNNLLKINNGIINMDFISNFYRYIYYDIDDIFKIVIQEGKYKWDNEHNERNKYNIMSSFIQPHGNTSILFLESKDGRERKVLKIFNKIDVSHQYALQATSVPFIGTNLKIKDYLSLEISQIKPNKTTTDRVYDVIGQNNNYTYSQSAFDFINFNMQKQFITNQENNNIYLSCKNNDAINDYIINLILQKINSENGGNHIKFVTYDNLCVLKINGEFKYCILMEHMNGSLANYIDKLDPDTKRTNDIILDSLNQIEDSLNKLKTKHNLFTHTDMKMENIFYKIDEDNRIISYLADFDKSSITYHNIRFYNDITKSADMLKSYMSPTSVLGSYIATDKYTLSHLDERIASDRDNGSYRYRLSRIGMNYQGPGGFEIESEQLYMRYNLTPYYTSFDMCSLLCSLFTKHKISKIEDDTNRFTDIGIFALKYITQTHLKKIFVLYNTLTIAPNDIGNFGKLMSPLILRKDDITDCFIHKFTNPEITGYENLYINHLYITRTSSKIALTIPFYIRAIQKAPLYSITMFKNDMDRTNTLYQDDLRKSDTVKSFIAALNDENFQIEYNTDSWLIQQIPGSTYVAELLGRPTIIIKTNRYSSIGNKIYDYDDCTEGESKIILKFFQNIANQEKLALSGLVIKSNTLPKQYRHLTIPELMRNAMNPNNNIHAQRLAAEPRPAAGNINRNNQ